MNARSLATAHIARAARRFPDFEATGDADIPPEMDARDAGLAAAIEHHVQRRWLTLSTILQQRLTRPWEDVETKLQAALLTGSAQLLLMDRLPDYAVIDETVEWAKANVREKAGGMVNAVLRQVAALRGDLQPAGASRTSWARNELPLHDGRVRQLTADVFSDSDLPRLAQQTSHPLELVEHWVGLFGVQRTTETAAHNLVHAPIIVHGISAETAASRSDLQPHDEPGFFVFHPEAETSVAELLRALPQAIVQDPTSAQPALATREVDPKPRVIVDACAGRGTKTRQLAALHPNAEIYATDIDEARLETLREAFAGHDRVRVIEHRRLSTLMGRADLLVLDVPCSNTGVLARRGEAKHRFTPASLQSLVNMQRQIIADSLILLSERGSILYATCSIDPAENDQARWITQWHPFTIASSASAAPAGLPGEPAAAYRDGGFWALLRKT